MKWCISPAFRNPPSGAGLKLRELDRQKLEERVTQGATLMDLASWSRSMT